MNPYFDVETPIVIQNIEELMSLNVAKTYYRSGDETVVTDILNYFQFPHLTSGMFRGQLRDWPLMPKSFRDLDVKDDKDAPSDSIKSYKYLSATSEFTEFCERAEIHNPEFPSDVSGRMSIAQHFGINTPLLDWSQGVFPATFFAIREVYSDPKFENDLKVFIYHITDERYLNAGIPEGDELPLFSQSAYIKPHHIDRRIERQRSVFSFHPHPILAPSKIPVKVYILEWDIIANLLKMMKGFGFTEDYFPPDYAGIANAVKSEVSL